MFACNFAPSGWAFCNGTIQPVRANPALYSVIKNFYGGGPTTFALPNLQALAAMHWGAGPGLTPRTIGENLGEPSVVLTTPELPVHSHAPGAANLATATTPANLTWSSPGNVRPAPNFYATKFTNPVAMDPQLIGNTGGGLAHNNLMPYLVVNFCIATQGDLPEEEGDKIYSTAEE